MARIFISYKRLDKEKVFKIKDRIEHTTGVDCWIDLDGIESDAQFANVIIRAINDSEIVLFMYSKLHNQIEDFENDWTARELSFAKKKNKRIVFINIDGTPLSDYFEFLYSTKQQIDASNEEQMSRLCADIQKWLGVSRPNHGTSDDELLNQAEEYGKAEEWDKYLAIIRPLAEKGNAEAQNNLGECFFYGDGVNENHYEAVKWYRKAAEQGYAEAQNNLGFCYYYYYGNKGVPQDSAEAVKWWRKAAEQGHAYAQYHLGECYDYGLGVQEDKIEAFSWFTKAAKQGHSDAIIRLKNSPCPCGSGRKYIDCHGKNLDYLTK